MGVHCLELESWGNPRVLGLMEGVLYIHVKLSELYDQKLLLFLEIKLAFIIRNYLQGRAGV